MFYSWQRNSPCCLVEEMCNPEKDQSSKILIVPLNSHSLHTGIWGTRGQLTSLTEIANLELRPNQPSLVMMLLACGVSRSYWCWCQRISCVPVCINDLARHGLIIWSVTLSHCPIVRLPTGQFRLNTPAHSLGLEWSPDGPDSAVNPHLRNHFGRTTLLINWLLMPLSLFDIWCCKGVIVLGQVFVRDYQSAQESLLGVSKALPLWDHISNLKSSGYEY